MENEQTLPSAVESFKSAIVAAAAEAVVAQMSPEQMLGFAQEILNLALADLTKPYGKFHQALSEAASKAAVAYLSRPEAIKRVQQGVEDGVNQALDGLPAQARGVITDRCKEALVKILTAPELVRRF